MTAIKFACICPHPPIIVEEVSRGRQQETEQTVEAMRRLAADLAMHRPKNVLLMATHGPLNPGAFFLLVSQDAKGDFARWGAPSLELSFPSDPEIASGIHEQAEKAGLPLDISDNWEGGLDWSCTVPLYFLKDGMAEARLVPMNISLLSARQHFEFGKAVRRAVELMGRPAAIVASADLSNRLSENSPYGFDPAGPEFDQRMQEAIAGWDVRGVLAMEESFREAAGDDAIPSISFLMGVLDGLRVRPRILSYEGPYGVGYMVAAIDILDEAKGLGRLAEYREEPQPARGKRVEVRRLDPSEIERELDEEPV